MVVESHHDYGSFPSAAASVNGRQGERSRSAMDESDAYMQSRPLLQDDGWRGTENGDVQHGAPEPASNGGFYQATPAGGGAKGEASVRVNIGTPAPLRFPKEKLKTLLALLWMVFNFLLTLTSLAITHERVPDTPPLPDIVLDNVPTGSWALKVSETVIIVMVNSAFLVVLLHKHRFIVFRRIFLIMGLLYMMRSVLYFVTALPKPDPDYQCEPKAGYLSFTLVVTRVLKLFGGFGLSINGQHVYCGDYIYSGHTVTLTMAYMVLREYTPRHWWVLHWASLLAALTGVVMVLIARGHYTVDVLIAYYVTTRVFWLYHTMSNNAALKESGPNNYLSRIWWFFIFRYFERNVSGPVPRHYEWPLPWPRCLQNKRPERTS
ncbi:phosphatidylcholine:ceramide cholinephosphotransferase 1-like isoform X2 [Pollicipes pollicipes]|nr:phosphatidylcholine:ceramide cholinephosphotransferase 1-like isoform X2 [Pollicipes pollicipes]XP_037072873.1 phosphatidylcholine:ceramide cholinephosphotransferase 1-like isoform X2 [Pollicipes pollicipes]XP_037072881.1 phosphatidylcholine:ceramide cholinephosphotransferase 1-like isoform X2 [Pollicipes pollicipes]XP_037072891.1 phosphatidylcholine:ceramide cholinephosphotransferase 1-like isoform X2 [Pollicipes pollicipes]XP_037072896.1 phosphatidylcholine:ceramide cholinephosphotransfera